MFLLVETLCQKVKFFCTIVYASNSYIERRKLWKDLGAQNIITSGDPWSILGDFNVSLKIEEHSNGCFALSNEMNEFLEITKEIEVEDILNHSSATLKIPNGLEKRRKAFRFSNFVTDKKEFSSTVKKGVSWEKYKVTDFPTNTIMFPNMLSRKEASRMCRDVSEVEVKNNMLSKLQKSSLWFVVRGTNHP
ncbi:RNA-directed DNA polymerase, eukaryota, reverse transcriptase zinc-binding domain protein [Tanacetum coccineum]|uniref:RNA-directed DNA polymerase, eukaryota, reverse transcriptase zinc-binding domain protein n=1 Tax=Tanacetum coccineum TaxID=301880 RepID=A0ABQ5BUC0_9ASTR